MQKCFLVTNKETQVASYLKHRSIMEVTEEHRSLTEINLEKLDIVDVDKFLYIYYKSDDAGLSFRSDMNALRTLLRSAFFHTSEAQFILVNDDNPLTEDLIHSALRDSTLPRDKIEVIHHEGTLMLADVGHYLAGSAGGQTTSSSYRDVYIREADKEEKERYDNKSGELNAVLPVLTDMAALYSQRASVEAISAGRVVQELAERPQLVSDFSRITVDTAKTVSSFVVSGERWTGAERAVKYLLEYYKAIGRRVLIINLDDEIAMDKVIKPSTNLSLMDIKIPLTPELPFSVINCRFDQFGYVIQFLRNIKGIEQYIFFSGPNRYDYVCRLVRQLSEQTYNIYVAHYSPESVQRYLTYSINSTALFLSFEHFKRDFDLKDFKEQLKGTVVAAFPTEDVDYIEFFSFSTGGVDSDE